MVSDAKLAIKAELLNSKKAKETAAEIKNLAEAVDAPGRKVLESTGKISPEVNIKGKIRRACNSIIAQDNGVLYLPNGISMPILTEFDATASMGENVEIIFDELGTTYEMLSFMRERYNIQLANFIVQDVADSTPVVQGTQFESGDEIVRQLRLLISGANGWDRTEDYDLAELYTLVAIVTDIFNHYGLKGYRFVIGDERGRGVVKSADAMKHIGWDLPGNGPQMLNKSDMLTRDITKALGERWHQFYLQVEPGGPATEDHATAYWKDAMGSKGHVVLVPDAHLLAEFQVAIIYLTETAQVSKDEFVSFMTKQARSANNSLTNAEILSIWNALTVAGIEIGAATRLPNFNIIPLPGEGEYAHYRHAWPIGHPNEHLNVTPDASDEGDSGALATEKPKSPRKWGSGKF